MKLKRELGMLRMETSKSNALQQLRGKLIVSCQALPEEPLYSPFIMGRMAYAVALGGAAGIRANSVEDIREIKKNVKLPIIGIIKRVYRDSEVFITPTKQEIDELASEGVDIIAMDATRRVRPDGSTIDTLFPAIKQEYPDQLFMADCATFTDALRAEMLGFDCVGTTLSGYTAETKDTPLPDFELLQRMVREVTIPVIAEGGISTPEELRQAYKLGIHTAVVGSAITRPLEITKRFTKVIATEEEMP